MFNISILHNSSKNEKKIRLILGKQRMTLDPGGNDADKSMIMRCHQVHDIKK